MHTIEQSLLEVVDLYCVAEVIVAMTRSSGLYRLYIKPD